MAKKKNIMPWIIGGIAAYLLLSKKGIKGIFGPNDVVKNLEFHAKRFTDSYGNTYHVVRVYVNDDLLGVSKMTYGYERAYEQTAIDMLKKAGYLMDFDWNGDTLWQYCTRNGIKLISNAKDVKKRDLFNWP